MSEPLADRIRALHLALLRSGHQRGGAPDATSDLTADIDDSLTATEALDALILVVSAATPAIDAAHRREAVCLWQAITGDDELTSADEVDAWLHWDGSGPPPWGT